MKRTIILVLLLTGFSSVAVCDYKDEIETLQTRMVELAGSETGMSDSD